MNDIDSKKQNTIAGKTISTSFMSDLKQLLSEAFSGGKEEVLTSFEEIEGVRIVQNINIQWTGEGTSSAIWLPDRACPTLVYRAPDCDGTYFQYGLHRLGDDYLTYISKTDDEPVIIHLVDCREGSKTLHNRLSVTLKPDITRAIVIPRGVAHLPTNLKGAICLNNHKWFVDLPSYLRYSRKFDIQNVPVDTESANFPVIKTARFAVPIWAYPIFGALIRLRIVPENNWEVPFYFDGTMQGKPTTVMLRRKHSAV